MKIVVKLCLCVFVLVSIQSCSGLEDTCLIASYPFSGDAKDESGNGNHGLTFGALQLVEDRFGNGNSAYLFNGYDCFIECDGAAFNFGKKDYSLSYWVKRKGTGNHYILSKERKGDAKTPRFASAICSNPNAFVDYNLLWFREAGIESSSMWSRQQGYNLKYKKERIQSDKWYHVVVVNKEGLLSLYLNGEKVSEHILDEKYNLENDYNLRIGARYARVGAQADDFFRGVIDDIKIYNCSISESKIERLYKVKPKV